MDHVRVLAQFQEQVKHGTAEATTRFPGYIRLVSQDWALVTATTLTEADLDAAIRTEIAFFGHENREFEWKVYSWDTPANLHETLTQFGFERGDEEAIMVFDLREDVGHWATNQNAVRVESAKHLEDYRTVEKVSWPDHSVLNEIIESLEKGTTDVMAYIAYHHGQPVSIARLNCQAGRAFAGCYGGFTLPDFRHQGFYRSLLHARAQEARRLGARYLQVDSLPTSRPTLERLGFERLGSTWPFAWSPGLMPSGKHSD